MNDLLGNLQRARIVAVIRASSRESLVPLAEALLAGGISCLEVTLSTPDALGGIADLRTRFGDQVLLGVGTVLDAALCQPAVDAGASFVVSPIFDPAIVEASKRAGAVAIPGAFTPTEIFRAWSAGADVVKVFPATTLGPGYFRDLLAPMPDLRLMPTGGVDASNVASWFQAGAFAVGVGGKLCHREAIIRGAWSELTESAAKFSLACG